MSSDSRALRLFGFAVALAIVGCSSDSDCAVGSEGCECTGGGACDEGLTCLSNLCVDPGGDGDADADDIPEPCLENTGRLEDVEPNDSPAQPSRGCTLGQADEETVTGAFLLWDDFGSLGGEDLVDYYVFRTVDVDVDVTIGAWIVWGPLDEDDEPTPVDDTNLIDAIIYRAVAGEDLEEVFRADRTGTEEEFEIALPPATRYLMELRVPEQNPMPPATPYGIDG